MINKLLQLISSQKVTVTVGVLLCFAGNWEKIAEGYLGYR